MVDCRKNVSYKIKTEGKYLVQLNKEDLRHAGSLVSMIISNNTIQKLMKDQTVQKYELDYVKHIDSRPYDIVYENPTVEDKFVNLPEKIVPIMQANQQNDLDVCVGSCLFPMEQFQIPKNTLQSSTDLVLSLTNAVAKQDQFNNFVIALHQTQGKFLVELIPETGAA